MPTPRGSVALCDEIEDHGEELINLLDVVEKVMGDGIVKPDETKLVKLHMARVRTTFAPLPKDASEQDDALKCIGAIAGAGKVTTRWVVSQLKQAAADTERLAA